MSNVCTGCRYSVNSKDFRISILSLATIYNDTTRPEFVFGDPVVLESISCRTGAKQLFNKSKMTEWLKKNWTGTTGMAWHNSKLVG